MKALSRRQKVTLGTLAVVAMIWVVDLLTGGAGPSQADAATTPTVPHAPAEPTPAPDDLAGVIEALQREQVTRATLPFERVGRDLFVPTERFEAALSVARKAEGGEATDEPEGPAHDALPFEDRHKLQGVLTGRVPLALIDGVLLREGAEIDGYRLVEIHADFVVLRRGPGKTVALHVAPGKEP
jgi:hypothetical protein